MTPKNVPKLAIYNLTEKIENMSHYYIINNYLPDFTDKQEHIFTVFPVGFPHLLFDWSEN